jgi:hypothetical protein
MHLDEAVSARCYYVLLQLLSRHLLAQNHTFDFTFMSVGRAPLFKSSELLKHRRQWLL